jgi:ribosomal protein L40E
MALRYECKRCGAMRPDTMPCRVCGSGHLRPVSVRMEAPRQAASPRRASGT